MNDEVPNETVPSLSLTQVDGQSRLSPSCEELSIIQGHLNENIRDLETFTGRVEAANAKIIETKERLRELRVEIEETKFAHEETTRVLTVELGVRKAVEHSSREVAKHIAPSTCATGLIQIQSNHVEKSLSILNNKIQTLQADKDRQLRRISEIEWDLKREYTRLSLLSDQANLLEAIRAEFRNAVRRKQALIILTRLPTEILLQIFDMVVEEVICDRIFGEYSLTTHPTLTLASVCHRWHDIATDTPSLWRYIPIYSSTYLYTPTSSLGPVHPFIPMEWIHERAKWSNVLFLALGVSTPSPGLLHYKASALSSLTKFSIHFPGEPTNMAIPPCRVEKYAFYNIYPDFSAEARSHVTSLTLSFRATPMRLRLMQVINDLGNLAELDIYIQDSHRRPKKKSTIHALCPSLKRLSVPLSMTFWFFNGEKSVSREMLSLKIHADYRSFTNYLSQDVWSSTAEGCGLAATLRYLAIDGSKSPEATEHVITILPGLTNVVSLSLHGPFMAPVLDKLSRDPTLLPALYRLEMRQTDAKETMIEQFLDSRGRPQDSVPASVSIRELVFDRCSEITRAFCGRVGQNVEEMTVYC